MTVCVDSASNMAVERPAGSHSLAAAAYRQRSPHGRAAIVEECSA